MNELQVTFINGKAFVWGFSSDTDIVFTPADEISSFFSGVLDKKYCKKTQRNIELPSFDGVPAVPLSMKLFYGQYDTGKAENKAFKIEGIESGSFSQIADILYTKKGQGMILGGSFDFFGHFLRFSYALVSRERFAPCCKGGFCCFTANLDINEDYETFLQLVRSAPLCVRQNSSVKIEIFLRDILDFFVNSIVTRHISDIRSGLKNQTKSDKWLIGLFEGNVRAGSRICADTKAWLERGKVDHNLEFVMLFKLTEPEEDGDWTLSFNMQSKRDPSLIIGLDELWKGKSKIPIKNLRMHLLKDLGIAANASQVVTKSLNKPNPYEARLSTDDAYNFIASESYLLKDLGFVVHIPKINLAGRGRIKARIKLKGKEAFKIAGTGMLGNALFDFDYTISIDGAELTEEEFFELSKSKEKLVKVKNKWVEINHEDVNRALKYFNARKQISIHDTFIANSSQEGFEIDDVIAPVGFEKEISGLFDFKKIKKYAVPENFNGELRAYQKEGFSWMLFLRQAGFGGILADDMGLGKTIQAITYILCSRGNASLVICPTSVIRNWEKEFSKFSPSLKVHVHHGALRKKGSFKWEKEYDVVITSYATIRRDETFFAQADFGTVILDEAQNIKNPLTKQAAAINKLKSSSRFCLTGTPIENRLSEFWSIMNFANPGFLSGWKTFKKNFAEPIELEEDASKSELLKRITAPFIMRRVKTDKSIISDLPLKTEMKEYCQLTEEQASIYQAVVDDSLEKLQSEDDENRRAMIMAALIKLKQVCNHPANYLKDSAKLSERSGKVCRLREIVSVIMENNEKCLIFTQYREMGGMLKADLEDRFGMPVCFLHGGLSTKAREQMIELFQSDYEHSPKIFILSLKAGGTGINLTKANHVIHFDRWWNPAVENQATDRAFRIGQKKNVFVYKLITSGTVEEKIDEMIEKKTALSENVLSRGEKGVTELNNNELRELFELRNESLAD